MRDLKGSLAISLSLYLKSNVGPASFIRLSQKFPKIEDIYGASPKILREICPHFSDSTISDILSGPDEEKVNQQLEFCRENNITIISLSSGKYPVSLRYISNPPPFLFVKGKWPLDNRALGIVGTRMPTHYGEDVAAKLTRNLVQSGYTIVSGLAVGIDTISHQAALDIGGHTVAVLGCGLDTVYPNQNATLFENIGSRGTLLTEFPIGAPPEQKNFPLRNRIISGLSRGVLVVEAGIRSGALITCSHAIKQQKPVFAVPGSVFCRKADGPNWLIQNGANLVSHPADIDNILKNPGAGLFSLSRNAMIKKRRPMSLLINDPEDDKDDLKEQLEPLTDQEKKVYQLIDQDNLHLDKISELSGSVPHTLLFILLSLEMKGLVKRKPGAIYSRSFKR